MFKYVTVFVRVCTRARASFVLRTVNAYVWVTLSGTEPRVLGKVWYLQVQQEQVKGVSGSLGFTAHL
jgi:hypothetical protein